MIMNDVVKLDMSSGTYGYDGINAYYTDVRDGTLYIWDREKSAWFPKVKYQLYGLLTNINIGIYTQFPVSHVLLTRIGSYTFSATSVEDF